MKSKANESKIPGGNCTNNHHWAPLSYPSAAIFSSSQRSRHGGGGIQDPSIARIADPFFPLHRDVLLAAMRELLIIDGKIDHCTMEINMPTSSCDGKNNDDNVVGATKEDLDSQSKPDLMPRKRKGTGNLVVLSSDDDEKVNGISSFKKQCTRGGSSVGSITTPYSSWHNIVKDKVVSQPHPHVVPIETAADQRQKGPLDYTQFKTAEDLVDHAVNGNSPVSMTDKKKPPSKAESIRSKRKVSDAHELDKSHDNTKTDFPFCIVSLVRSNIMVLQKTCHKSGSKQQSLSKLTPQYGTELDLSISAKSVETLDDAILSFLRHPKLQREQQLGKAEQTLFVLPRLVDASIENEYALRARAHEMVSSMVNDSFGNDLNVPLRTFLGYKMKTIPTRERIVEMISDVLFDVSHAMYVWIHTEEDVARAQGRAPGANNTNQHNMDMQIRACLFDDRALKHIGGFEPGSLLPLAIGIHRCRRTSTSWKDYALSQEGRMAMSVHTKQKDGCPVGEDGDKEETFKSRARKKQTKAATKKNALLEIGKKRRGRRSQSVTSSCPL